MVQLHQRTQRHTHQVMDYMEYILHTKVMYIKEQKHFIGYQII